MIPEVLFNGRSLMKKDFCPEATIVALNKLTVTMYEFSSHPLFPPLP